MRKLSNREREAAKRDRGSVARAIILESAIYALCALRVNDEGEFEDFSEADEYDAKMKVRDALLVLGGLTAAEASGGRERSDGKAE